MASLTRNGRTINVPDVVEADYRKDGWVPAGQLDALKPTAKNRRVRSASTKPRAATPKVAAPPTADPPPADD